MRTPCDLRDGSRTDAAILNVHNWFRARTWAGPGWSLDGGGSEQGHSDGAGAADAEGELGAAAVAEPADDEGSQGREAVPGVVVEAEHATAQVVGARELDRGVRVRGVAREEDPADEEEE